MHVPLHQASGSYCHFPQCVFSRLSGEIDWSIIWGKPNPPLVIYWSAATLQPLIEHNEPLTMHGRDGNHSRGHQLTSNQPTIHWHCTVATVDIISYRLLYLSVVLMLLLFSVIRAQKEKKNDISEYNHLGVLAQILSKLGQLCCFWTRVWLDSSVPLEPNKKRGRTIGMTSLISG